MNVTLVNLSVSVLDHVIRCATQVMKLITFTFFGMTVLQVILIVAFASSLTLQRIFIFLNHNVFSRSMNYLRGHEQGPLEPPSQYGFISLASVQPLRLSSGRFTLGAWHITLKKDLRVPSDIVFFYLHGNLGHRVFQSRLLFYKKLLQVFPNSELLVIDYRGFGDSNGHPSQKGLLKDAMAGWQYLTDKKNISHDRIVVLGSSLGSTIATLLANKLTKMKTCPRALVLFAAPTNIPDAIGLHDWVQWLFYIPLLFVPMKSYIVEQFDALSVTQSSDTLANCPILYIHGDGDGVIPHTSSRTLHSAALARRHALPYLYGKNAENNKETWYLKSESQEDYRQIEISVNRVEKLGFMTVKGGAHDNLQEFIEVYEAIKQFLELMQPCDMDA